MVFSGRFDREIAMTMPDELARAQILKTMTRSMRLDGHFDFGRISHKTAGYFEHVGSTYIYIYIWRVCHDIRHCQYIYIFEVTQESIYYTRDLVFCVDACDLAALFNFSIAFLALSPVLWERIWRLLLKRRQCWRWIEFSIKSLFCRTHWNPMPWSLLVYPIHDNIVTYCTLICRSPWWMSFSKSAGGICGFNDGGCQCYIFRNQLWFIGDVVFNVDWYNLWFKHE